MSRKWQFANRFLGARKRIALADGQSLEWIESDLILALRAGELVAKGQQIHWQRTGSDDALLPGSGLDRERGPDREIPPQFWDSLIFHRGRTDWENCHFQFVDPVSGEGQEFDAVRISQPVADLPPDKAILEQALAMQRKGMDRDEIAKSLRLEPGFEAVTNEHVRSLLKGTKPRGRPRKPRKD